MRGVLIAELLVARTELYPSLTRVTSGCNVEGHSPDDFISKVGTNDSTRETRGCLRDNIEKVSGLPDTSCVKPRNILSVVKQQYVLYRLLSKYK